MATSDAIRRRRTVPTAVDYFITAMMPLGLRGGRYVLQRHKDERKRISGIFSLKSSVPGHALVHERRSRGQGGEGYVKVGQRWTWGGVSEPTMDVHFGCHTTY